MPLLQKTLHAALGLHAEYFYRDGHGSDILAITFTERGNTELNGLGFGGAFLRDRGADILAVKSSNFRWFEELAPAVAHITAQLTALRLGNAGRGYKQRVCYGSSMGAHAAIRYSAGFQATRVVAISPLFDILANQDQRYAEDIPRLQTRLMMAPANIALDCDYFILYDPHDPDALHVERFREIIPAARFNPVRLPFSGHPAGFFLSETGVLKEVVTSLITQGAMPNLRRLNIDRLRSQYYRYCIANACLKAKKYRWAANFLLAGEARGWFNAETKTLFARVYAGLKDWPAAEAAARAAIALDAENTHRKLVLVEVFAKMQATAQALALLDEMIAAAPEVGYYRWYRGEISRTQRTK